MLLILLNHESHSFRRVSFFQQRHLAENINYLKWKYRINNINATTQKKNEINSWMKLSVGEQ